MQSIFAFFLLLLAKVFGTIQSTKAQTPPTHPQPLENMFNPFFHLQQTLLTGFQVYLLLSERPETFLGEKPELVLKLQGEGRSPYLV